MINVWRICIAIIAIIFLISIAEAAARQLKVGVGLGLPVYDANSDTHFNPNKIQDAALYNNHPLTDEGVLFSPTFFLEYNFFNYQRWVSSVLLETEFPLNPVDFPLPLLLQGTTSQLQINNTTMLALQPGYQITQRLTTYGLIGYARVSMTRKINSSVESILASQLRMVNVNDTSIEYRPTFGGGFDFQVNDKLNIDFQYHYLRLTSSRDLDHRIFTFLNPIGRDVSSVHVHTLIMKAAYTIV